MFWLKKIAFGKNSLAFYLGPVLPPRTDGSPLADSQFFPTTLQYTRPSRKQHLEIVVLNITILATQANLIDHGYYIYNDKNGLFHASFKPCFLLVQQPNQSSFKWPSPNIGFFVSKMFIVFGIYDRLVAIYGPRYLNREFYIVSRSECELHRTNSFSFSSFVEHENNNNNNACDVHL